MAAPFVHLHVHSQYSLLDGAIRIPDLVRHAVESGAGAVAVTDHDALFGAISFYRAARAAGIRPVIGAEIRVDATGGDGSARPGHLVLLATGTEGYRNLLGLVSAARLLPEGNALPVARIAGRTGGVLALTGCLGGSVIQPLLHDGPEAAAGAIARLRDVFPDGNLYLEIQSHGLPEQPAVNEFLASLGRREGLPVVATNDAHYVGREDAEAYEVLRCIKSGRTLADIRDEPLPPEMYLKTAAEMRRALPDYGDALEMSHEVASRCDVTLDFSRTVLPEYQTPEGRAHDEHLRAVATAGLARRLESRRAATDAETYRVRLAHELDVICRMGFAGYYLIVWDFVRVARERGVPVGPGRGSGAGSLVAYSLGITDLDPIEHKLLFERFLNPERISMPDFDIDFCMDRRDVVLAYLVERYGEGKVGQIATFHELKSRSVVRDVGRAMGMAYGDVDRIAKMIPPPLQGKACPVSDALEHEPRLRELHDSDPQVRKLLETAVRLEGLLRHAGTHAAGVVIADRPLEEYVPLFRGQGGEIVSQFDKDDVEKTGLVKFDLLGLTTLTVIDLAEGLVRARPDHPDLDLSRIPMDDPATFKLLQSGQTIGVFQLEGQGMQDLFRRLRPDRFEDIVAAVALFRPGPMQMVEGFVRRKHGKEAVTYPHPALEEILHDTYGVIVYQEQVMQIASRLAGYSLGQADLLRRAMGKKIRQEMEAQREPFVEGASRSGVDRAKALEIWTLLETFAEYGFNRSHAAAYALLSYRTAYLKAHYPVEFICALLSVDKDKTDKLVRILAEGRALGIGILPPDVNESDIDFRLVYEGTIGRIRFGLGAVKGVGAAALETVLRAREDGPFRDLFDFCARVDLRKVTRSVVEALVKAGAFDRCPGSAGLSRSRLFAAVDLALERGRAASRDRDSGQQSLFGMFDGAASSFSAAPASAGDYPEVPPWDAKRSLEGEREAVGFYVSGHPLDRYLAGLGRLVDTTSADLEAREEGAKVTLAGVIEAYRERTLRSGAGRMAYFDLEDRDGRVPVVVFARTHGEVQPLLTEGALLLVQGTIRREDVGDDTTVSVILDVAEPLARASESRARQVCVRVSAVSLDRDRLAGLLALFERHPGRCPVSIVVEEPPEGRAVFTLEDRYSVAPSEEFIGGVEQLFGSRAVEIG